MPPVLWVRTLDTLKEKKIVGYYTASTCVIVPSELPLDMRKKLNRYERVHSRVYF